MTPGGRVTPASRTPPSRTEHLPLFPPGGQQPSDNGGAGQAQGGQPSGCCRRVIKALRKFVSLGKVCLKSAAKSSCGPVVRVSYSVVGGAGVGAKVGAVFTLGHPTGTMAVSVSYATLALLAQALSSCKCSKSAAEDIMNFMGWTSEAAGTAAKSAPWGVRFMVFTLQNVQAIQLARRLGLPDGVAGLAAGLASGYSVLAHAHIISGAIVVIGSGDKLWTRVFGGALEAAGTPLRTIKLDPVEWSRAVSFGFGPPAILANAAAVAVGNIAAIEGDPTISLTRNVAEAANVASGMIATTLFVLATGYAHHQGTPFAPVEIKESMVDEIVAFGLPVAVSGLRMSRVSGVGTPENAGCCMRALCGLLKLPASPSALFGLATMTNYLLARDPTRPVTDIRSFNEAAGRVVLSSVFYTAAWTLELLKGWDLTRNKQVLEEMDKEAITAVNIIKDVALTMLTAHSVSVTTELLAGPDAMGQVGLPQGLGVGPAILLPLLNLFAVKATTTHRSRAALDSLVVLPAAILAGLDSAALPSPVPAGVPIPRAGLGGASLAMVGTVGVALLLRGGIVWLSRPNLKAPPALEDASPSRRNALHVALDVLEAEETPNGNAPQLGLAMLDAEPLLASSVEPLHFPPRSAHDSATPLLLAPEAAAFDDAFPQSEFLSSAPVLTPNLPPPWFSAVRPGGPSANGSSLPTRGPSALMPRLTPGVYVEYSPGNQALRSQDICDLLGLEYAASSSYPGDGAHSFGGSGSSKLPMSYEECLAHVNQVLGPPPWTLPRPAAAAAAASASETSGSELKVPPARRPRSSRRPGTPSRDIQSPRTPQVPPKIRKAASATPGNVDQTPSSASGATVEGGSSPTVPGLSARNEAIPRSHRHDPDSPLTGLLATPPVRRPPGRPERKGGGAATAGSGQTAGVTTGTTTGITAGTTAATTIAALQTSPTASISPPTVNQVDPAARVDASGGPAQGNRARGPRHLSITPGRMAQNEIRRANQPPRVQNVPWPEITPRAALLSPGDSDSEEPPLRMRTRDENSGEGSS